MKGLEEMQRFSKAQSLVNISTGQA